MLDPPFDFSVASYAVRISPQAWGQIGRLPWDDFQGLTAAMRGLADTASWMPHWTGREEEGGAASSFQLSVDALVLRCEVNHLQRAIQLVDVQRQPERESPAVAQYVACAM